MVRRTPIDRAHTGTAAGIARIAIGDAPKSLRLIPRGRASFSRSDVRRLWKVQRSIYSGADRGVVLLALPLEPDLMRLEVGHAPRDFGAL
jgi:hypothetical protein